MKQFLTLSLVAVSLSVAGPARADKRKAKAPPPPVPTYWIGQFSEAGDTVDAGKLQAGTVTVADEAAPKDAILVQPLDPDHFATPATAEATADKKLSYKASYLMPQEVMTGLPMVIVVPATQKPVLLKTKTKASKKIANAVRDRAVKETEEPEIDNWDVGLADLDADGVADVALMYGCLGGADGICASNLMLVFERDGKSWKRKQ